MINELEFSKEFERRFGCPPIHARVKHSQWEISVFDKLEFESQRIKDAVQMKKLQDEIYNNPNKSLKRFYHETNLNNILLNGGMTASGQRDTNENTDTGVTHGAVGTDATAESASQTGLIVAYGSRKVLNSRSCLNQISSYFFTMSDADLTVPVDLKEAALYNAVSGGIAHNRIQYPTVTLTAGQLISFQIYEYMVNG